MTDIRNARGARAARGVALAMLLAAPGALRGQEVAASPDSVELVDRVVAVVGDTVILYSEILEQALQLRAQGQSIPDPGTAAFDTLGRQLLEGMVDNLVLLQKAEETEIRISPDQLDAETNRQFLAIRNGFQSPSAFEEAVQKSGRTVIQYRQFLRGQVRMQMMIGSYVQQTREQRPPVSVSEEEIRAYFDEQLAGKTQPAAVSFEQLAVEPRPSDEAREAARVEAETALSELRAGEEFEVVARRYSDDPGSRESGGELGWVRRDGLVPEFSNAAWTARTGAPIGPVWTRYGWHIIQVDNVRGGERRIRHVLIRPEMGPADAERALELAQALADSARAGIPIVELAERHGMRDIPVRIPLIRVDALEENPGPAYARALANPIPGEVIGPFAYDRLLQDQSVYIVLRVTELKQQGAFDLDEVREEIRQGLERGKAEERFIRDLRDEVYVDIRY